MSWQRVLFQNALMRADVSPGARRVGAYLSMWMNDRSGATFPAFDTVATAFGVSWIVFNRALDELEGAGLLRVERRKGCGGSRYWSVVGEADDRTGDVVLGDGSRLRMSRQRDVAPPERSRQRDNPQRERSRERDVSSSNVAIDPPECRASATEHLNIPSKSSSSSADGRVEVVVTRIAAEAFAAYGRPISNRPGLKRKMLATAREDYEPALRHLAAEHPDWTEDELYSAVQGVAQPAQAVRAPACSLCLGRHSGPCALEGWNPDE